MEFETFKTIGSYQQHNLEMKEPSCFNGTVEVRKYKVTVELVEETDEVIRERIQLMWDKIDNHHHRTPLRREAAKYGLNL